MVNQWTLWILPLSLLALAAPGHSEVAPAVDAEILSPGRVIPDSETTNSSGASAGGLAPETSLPSQNLDKSASPALTLSGWIAQETTAAVVITAVQVQETAAGLEVTIEADEPLTAGTSRTVGNALIIDIPNAVLNLERADQAEQFAPAEGIALVSVAELAGGGVQVSVTGTAAPPQVDVAAEGGNLVFAVVPGVAIADAADPEAAIRVGVEGAQLGSDYFVPQASTATRTETPLDEIPKSIQVVPQEVLEDQEVIRLNDALRNVSGVVSSSTDQRGEQFIIRGFNGAEVLRDGFLLTPGGFAGNFGFQELANVEQIEVLKGPAAVLYGILEPGGVINIVTEQPLAEPYYEFGLAIGNRAFVEPSLDISGPLTEDASVRYRLNALYRNEDSIRDFDTQIRRFFIAPVISWDISDRTGITFSLEYADDERPADFGGLPALGDRIADVPFDRITGEPGDDATAESLRLGYQFEHRFSDNWRVRNNFNYFFYNPEFVSNLAPSVVNEDQGDLFRVWIQNQQRTRNYVLQTNVQGNFTTGSIEHTLLAGIDLTRQDFTAFGRRDFTPQPLFNIFDPVYGVPRPEIFAEPLPKQAFTQTDTLGIYLQDQITLLDNLFLLAGIRYDTFAQETEDFDLDTTDNRSADAFSPRVGLVYQPIEDLSIYGSYSTSFAPNFDTDIDGNLLDPEEGEQFEVGLRSELLGRRLLGNLALFTITKQNVATFDPNSPPGEFFSVAVGEQRSRGIELDVIGELLPGWNIVANYAYTDAEITQDNADIEGNTLFGVPDHNFNLWTKYEIQDGPLTGLGVGLGFNYVSDRFGDNDNSFVLEDYFLTNAAVSYQRDNWQAAINIRNLFDVQYIDSSEGSRAFENRPGEGFTIIGSVSVEF